MITLYYFAGLKDKTGVESEQVPISGIRVDELLDYVKGKYEDFENGIVHVAINEEYAQLDEVLQDGDVVAFIPPVSGG